MAGVASDGRVAHALYVVSAVIVALGLALIAALASSSEHVQRQDDHDGHGGRPRPAAPAARRAGSGVAFIRSSGLVEEQDLEGLLARRGDREVQRPVADHDQRRQARVAVGGRVRAG